MTIEFFKCPGPAWETVMEKMPKPLPLEMVQADLIYLQRLQLQCGALLQGRPTLARRWGWSDWRTRQVLADVKLNASSKSSSRPPARLQRQSANPPAPERENLDNQRNPSSRPPAAKGKSSSAPPAPNTSYIKKDYIEKEKEINKEKAGEAFENVYPLHKKKISAKTERHGTQSHGETPKRSSVDSDRNGKMYSPNHALDRTDPGGYPFPPGAQSNTGGLEQGLYHAFAAYWQNLHPDDLLPPETNPEVMWVKKALKERGFRECTVVVDWAHESQDSTPQFLRKAGHCKIKTLFNSTNFYCYRNDAMEWKKKIDMVQAGDYASTAPKVEQETNESREPKPIQTDEEAIFYNYLLNEMIPIIGREDTEIWLAPTLAILRDNKLWIWTPNKFYSDWITENYLEQIKTLLENTGHEWGGFGTPPAPSEDSKILQLFQYKEIQA